MINKCPLHTKADISLGCPYCSNYLVNRLEAAHAIECRQLELLKKMRLTPRPYRLGVGECVDLAAGHNVGIYSDEVFEVVKLEAERRALYGDTED